VTFEHPWFLLTRHFIRRFFDTEIESDELRVGVPAMLGFATAPGLVACALLFDKYSTLKAWFLGTMRVDRDLATLPDKYFFLTLAFVISGLATVFKWDSLFPDRRDFMILSPLPLRPFEIFTSKLAALAVFVLMFAFAVNVAGAVLMPPTVLGNTGTLAVLCHYFLAHFTATVAASVGAALLVITAAGILLNVLPSAAMKRASSWMQFAFLVFFVTQFLMAPQVAPRVLAIYGGTVWQNLLFPPMWFVGSYQQVLGASAAAQLPMWAELSHGMLLGCGAAALALYGLSYFRHFAKTAETPDSGVTPGRVWRLLPMPKDEVQCAVITFMKQTLSRSAAHRVLLRSFLGLACAVILQWVLPHMLGIVPRRSDLTLETLAAPLVVSFALIAGLRLLIEVPADRPAGWAFRVVLDDTATDSILRGVRRVMLELGVVSWLIAITPVNVLLLGWQVGLAHTVFCLLLSLLLLDIVLYEYEKVPFATRLNTDRTFLGVWIAGWFSAFLVYCFMTTSIEVFLLQRPTSMLVATVVLFAAWRGVLARKRHVAGFRTGLDLSDAAPPVVLTLDLRPK
jgi:hypothetical protein